MTRAGWGLTATSVASVALALWLFVENRSLERQLADARAEHAQGAPVSRRVVAARNADPWTQAALAPTSARIGTGPAPKLPEQRKESRLERRKRHQKEFAAMFGRLDGETEEEYRSRIVPLIKAGLAIPRQRVEELRRQVEAEAGVTPEQSKQLDEAFDKIYEDALDYTNQAIADGVLSPYERNVAGWMEYAGGLGSILAEANGQIGQILTPQQVTTINESGFEWAEYLGANAPWEDLRPPPPPPQ